MTIWALSDPHLFFSTPDKNMNIFGPEWEGYTDKMAAKWTSLIKKEDLVLIPGDISWAMHLEDALTDLRWIDALPGTKVILRGNHDYWWSSNQKMAKVMPPTIHFINNNAFLWKDVAIGGSRLWDSRSEYTFDDFVHFQENPKQRKKDENIDSEKIFLRELDRLRLSLSQLSASAKVRIALTHYPPISADLRPSRVSAILEEYKIDYCIFGHLHNLKKGVSMFGEARGVRYLLTSCDYLDFTPIKVLETS